MAQLIISVSICSVRRTLTRLGSIEETDQVVYCSVTRRCTPGPKLTYVIYNIPL